MTPSRPLPLRAMALLAAAVTAGFLSWSWPLAGHLSTHTLVRERTVPPAMGDAAGWEIILANDQNLSLWGAADNARNLLGLRWTALMRQGQCYPMPGSTALGEHMIEVGVLAAPWLLLSGDPVLSYNLALWTALVVAAAGMFLFVHGHTASPAAAALAALAFAFAVPRLTDLPYHPAVVGIHWIPWVLWCFDRILQGNRRGAVAGFGLTLLLGAMVGAYPLLALALVGAVYGVVSIVGGRRRGDVGGAALAWCVAGALPALAITAAVLLEYARVQADWSIPPNAGAKFVVAPGDFLPGGILSVGAFALIGLVPLALLRGPAGGPAVAGLVAAAAAAFLVATALPLPGGSTWSLYETLARSFPLLDSVRAPGKVGLATGFALQALGAIGWSRLFARIPAPAATLVVVALAAVTALEVAPPSALRGVLGQESVMKLRPVAPAPERIAALRASIGADPGRRAVFDLPIGRMVKAPAALLDAAYHGRPTSACYNSLVPATVRAVEALQERMRSSEGVAELAAAGFGHVIERRRYPSVPLSSTAFASPARLLVFENDFAVWALPEPGPVHRDVSRLGFVAARGMSRDRADAGVPRHELQVEVTNRGETMWAAASDPEPLLADVQLTAATGGATFATRARGVLPLALAAGATTLMRLELEEGPAPGAWSGTVNIDGAAAPTAAGFAWSGSAR